MLPTTAIEQLAATLRSWRGVSDSDLLTILPKLANFGPALRHLGIV